MTLPQGFISFIGEHPQLSVLAQGLLAEPETSIRINRDKLPHYVIADTRECVPWCREGIYLSERPQFTFDPAMHQGLYYVQDASSMAICEAIRQVCSPAVPVRYLDACAAPGGKTTAALASLPKGSVVVANEYDYRRADILGENVSRWGNPNVLVSRGSTARLAKLRDAFDVVAVDAPCSGEGMMRKEARAVEQWSPSLIKQCAATQREILSNVWDALRPGGYLIYSTCTFNLSENEDNLNWLVTEYSAVPIEVMALSQNPLVSRGIDTPYPCYRFLPGKVKGEGLFLAVVRKPGSGTASMTDTKVKTTKRQSDLSKINDWFTGEVYIERMGDEIYALPQRVAASLCGVASKLDTILLGVHAATLKGHDLAPTHQLALSTWFDPSKFATAEVDYATAVKYLQRENIQLPPGTPKGYVVLTYKECPLGFVKNLGNRTNTLMPKSWRIISQATPTAAPVVI